MCSGFFLPLAGARVTMIDADLIPVDESAAHVAGDRHGGGAKPLQQERHRTTGPRTPEQPAGREQSQSTGVQQGVLRRALLARTLRWHDVEVVDDPWNGCEQPGRDARRDEVVRDGTQLTIP